LSFFQLWGIAPHWGADEQSESEGVNPHRADLSALSSPMGRNISMPIYYFFVSLMMTWLLNIVQSR